MENITPKNEIPAEKNQFKQIRQAIYALLIALVLVSASFAVILKISSDDLKNKDLKISAIISEVGEVKEDLDKSLKTVNAMFGELENAKNTLYNINHQVIRAAAEKELNWNELQKELTNAQENLNSAMLEKEYIINQLAHKNEVLKKDLIITETNPEILDVLILGQHGGLMDTVILGSANPKTHQISLVSLPRDLYHKGRKINELYTAYGIDEFKKAVYEITSVYPDKYIIFEMNSFVDFIDMLDGIQITVEKDLTDMSYPGPNFSYTTVSFKAGTQNMNGQTAIKYARSRKTTSDFDRSMRQQQIIRAVKEKALKLDLLSKLDLAAKIYAGISENIKSDINMFDALGYLQKYKDYELNTGNVISTGNYLYSTKNARGQYILLPKGENYLEIKEYIRNLLEG